MNPKGNETYRAKPLIALSFCWIDFSNKGENQLSLILLFFFLHRCQLFTSDNDNMEKWKDGFVFRHHMAFWRGPNRKDFYCFVKVFRKWNWENVYIKDSPFLSNNKSKDLDTGLMTCSHFLNKPHNV